jgi:S-adenosylmethionine:tRNA ribosyltransferase-isomerase
MLLVPEYKDYHVYDLSQFFNKGDVVIFNDTKVLPVRLFGKREGGDAKIEIMLHKMIRANKWWAFAKPGRKLKIDSVLTIANGFYAKVLDKSDDGVLLEFNLDSDDMFKALDKYGHVPLPPYIKREDKFEDKENYQTIYAKNEGAVAAPTAGLHFTPELMQALIDKGVKVLYVTLHVGAGTFLPVKVEDISKHKMHSEWGYIDQDTADYINKVKSAERNILAVGTTTLRILETAADDRGVLQEFKGETDIFITPGYQFKSANYLMTNFHLPKSTLFMLVSAFCGLDAMKKAYQHAIENGYRFYSYGDSSLLKCQNYLKNED